ncbi:MAG TPA: hypothetical protein VI408_16655 [Gaiellaceae bacterium]
MRFYPDVPRRRFATLAYDLLLLVLLAALAAIGLKVHDTVDKLAVLGEGVRKAGGAVPFGIGSPVEDLGRRGEDEVHHLANLLGALTFVLPAVVVLWHFLPRRLAQVKRLTLASRVLTGAPQRELAMRAAFSLPYERLLRFTDDPLGDVAAGRYDPLVAAILDDAGVTR